MQECKPYGLKKNLILASSSEVRKSLLESLKFDFKCIPAEIDERALLNLYSHKSNMDKVRLLSEAKAIAISERYAGSLVIGADQMVQLGDEILGKPGSLDKTIERLCRLESQEHQLLSGWAICLDRQILVSGTDVVKLKMRSLTEAQIKEYVSLEKPFFSCGGYYYESKGRLLFEYVQGSFDSLLGLPLEPIINSLWSLDLIEV